VQSPSRYIPSDDEVSYGVWFDEGKETLYDAQWPDAKSTGVGGEFTPRQKAILGHAKLWLKEKGHFYDLQSRSQAEKDVRRYLKGALGPLTIFFLRLFVSLVLKYLFDRYFAPVETHSEGHPWKRSSPSPD
jgi:hypothetical protein